MPWIRAMLAIALVAIATVRAAHAMTMTVDGDQIVLRGRMVPADAEQFARLLAANPAVTTVVLAGSPGGAAIANDRMTSMIEDRRLDTVVAGPCVSACAMLFLAGTHRAFGDLEPRADISLGFHASYRDHDELAPPRRIAALRARVIERTNGKIDTTLLDRWLAFTDQRQTIRFRYPQLATPSVFFCPQPRSPNTGDYTTCNPLTGIDALSAGIITTTKLTHIP